MIEFVKTKVWGILKEKEVSLAMIYNRDGEILWHMGREIKGKNINEGEGFSKTYIHKTLNKDNMIEKEHVFIDSSVKDLPESACKLMILSLIILPVSDSHFLYIDSGSKKTFSNTDREIFKVLGELLGETINQIKKNETEIGGITGNSEEIKKIREKVLKYALEEEPILLLGETGVGKSHIAELIHRYSGKRGKLVIINTPSIPENLFESEIFGHKKGAFTDAKADKKGFVDEAQGGTLFFDEVTDVPISFQAKLLRFIETKRYNLLGDTKERKADVRIIAATSRDLQEAIKKKEFRKDLYYRLNVLGIEVPPLRERKEDIKALVMENRRLLKGKEIGEGFWDIFFRYDWPGNVRELVTVLTRAGILLQNTITGKEIQDIIDQGIQMRGLKRRRKIDPNYVKIKAGKSFWDVVWKPFIKKNLNRTEVKRTLIRFYLESNRNLKVMTRKMNIEDKDYPRFISAIHKYDVHPGK